jgi:hypothetical protein
MIEYGVQRPSVLLTWLELVVMVLNERGDHERYGRKPL